MKNTILFLILTTLSLSAEPIRIEGSDALGAKLVPMLSELYQKMKPDSTFAISANGSTAAFAALIKREADIGMSNREPRAAELASLSAQGITLYRHVAAHDSLALIVNAENRIEALTLKQVEAIFTGDCVSWGQVGGTDIPIVVYTRNTSSSSYYEFQRLAMGGREYSPQAVKIAGSDHPVITVANDRQAITYVGLVYPKEANIRALRIGDREPSDPSYPLRRSFFYYMRSDAGQPAKDFVSWATSADEAIVLIRKVGFLEPEEETEPNNAMEPTPVNVTVPANAGTAPFTSVAHL